MREYVVRYYTDWKLCRESGGDLEQIQFLLGHASIQTTERYLGSRQNLKGSSK